MKKSPNRLAKETSPYLLQHASNPVDWFPWGSEALTRAKRENKPIFLSIGYSACHWCHVMEHESFENEETAALLNADFISVKVDREERPDIDHIYMGAVQALTQRGGWPLSVFLTPDLKPFYGGTYFPPEDRQGMPSFKRILSGIAQAWKARKEEVVENANQLTQALKEMQTQEGPKPETLHLDLVENGANAVGRSFDAAFGGLGSSPKFFHSMSFRLCLRHWKRSGNPTVLKLVTFTLDHLANGGIRDQLGGGFHRYSTDAEWLAPHFEKMLYDNALLAEWFLEAYQATGTDAYAGVARSTLDYVLREMSADEGGFCSTQDADSEGVEGKFYVWTQKEVVEALGEELGKVFCAAYDISPEGNWDGHCIPRVKTNLADVAQKLGQDEQWLEDELSVARRKLLTIRSQRIWPARDEKILLSWNGLMLSALALGHQVLEDERYLEAAQKTAAFLLEKFTAPQNLPSGKMRLLHSRKDGETRFNGYLDDYANLLNGLLSVFESDFDPRWTQAARLVADSLIDQFWDAKEQVFFFTGTDHESLITRPREMQDGATPSGQSIATYALLRLARTTGEQTYEDVARAALGTCEPFLRLIPTGLSQMLIALDYALEPSFEVVLVAGNESVEYEEALRKLRQSFLPHRSMLERTKDHVSIGGEVTLYVCSGFTCEAPIVGLAAVLKEIEKWKAVGQSNSNP